MAAYFDTNVIRYLRTGLARTLPAEVKRRIVVSPVSAVEVISQISDLNNGEEALNSIHRFRDWIPEQAVLLDWLEPFCAHYVFGLDIEDEFVPVISEMLNHALAAGHVHPALRAGAQELRRVNEKAKLRKAQLFQQTAERLRQERLEEVELDGRVRRSITLGIAQRVNANPSTRTQVQIEDSLAAYCEFHRQAVLRAIKNCKFRFDSRKHLNDHFDGEQLLYLAHPENHFISSDTGYNSVSSTTHGPRIHIVAPDILRDPRTAGPFLETLVGSCTPVRPASG